MPSVEPSHRDCVHREDYAALMAQFNHLRAVNYALASACQEAQKQLRELEVLLNAGNAN